MSQSTTSGTKTTRASYDDRQITAPLVTCAVCGRSWYMTKPEPVCIECMEAAVKAAGKP